MSHPTPTGPTIPQPFVATCAKCGRTVYYDIDPDGTPGFNGDWSDGQGDYGCEVSNGHVPTAVRFRRYYTRAEVWVPDGSEPF